MSYSNPEVNHDVNVSKQHPLKDALRLTAGLLLIAAILTVMVYVAARTMASWLPFRQEQKLADAALAPFLQEDAPPSACAEQRQRAQQDLQALADKLSSAMALPADMAVRVHLLEDDTPNAFATLGGNVVLMQGFLEKVDSENALAMVLAHEIGHVHHRDPIASVGGALAVAVVLSALAGGADGGSALASWSAGLTQLGFSRQQESAADAAALKALVAHYGHTAGADGFFSAMMKLERIAPDVPEFFATHPDLHARVQRIRSSAPAAGANATLTPVPASVTAWLQCVGGK